MLELKFSSKEPLPPFRFSKRLSPGVPGTIGDNLLLNLKGGSGSLLENFSSSIFSVKTRGVADFMYDSGIAGIQGENKTDTGFYKTVLFSYDFDSIDNFTLRNLVMNRTLDFLNCENGTGGPTGVPTSPPPFFPGEPPGEPPGLTDMPIPVVIFPTKPTTVVVTPRAVITGGGTIVGSPSTTTIEVKPSVATLSSWNFDNAPLCADQGWNEGTATQTAYCHLDTYNSLPCPTSGGNSWWCGANEPSWITPPGYGNNWDQALTLPSVDISTTVDPYIFFQYRINIIPDGDIALLEIFNRNTLNWDIITQISGLQ